MQHSFDIEIATKYGVNVAILLNNLVFWIKKNQANEKHFYKGRYWTYNSSKALAELFPYWTTDQIDRLIKKCKDLNLILVDWFNDTPYDRTRWFGLTDIALELYKMPIPQDRGIETNESLDTNREIAESYNDTDINTDINTDIKISCPSDDGRDKELKSFDCFWESYPRKEAKKEARKAWKKIKHEQYEQIISDVNQRKHYNWKDKPANYIPLPASYLNGERWNDQLFITSGEQQHGKQAQADRRNQFKANLERQTLALAHRYAEESLSTMD